MKIERFYLCQDRTSQRFIMGREEDNKLYEMHPDGEWKDMNLYWSLFNKKMILLELRDNEIEMVNINI